MELEIKIPANIIFVLDSEANVPSVKNNKMKNRTIELIVATDFFHSKATFNEVPSNDMATEPKTISPILLPSLAALLYVYP